MKLASNVQINSARFLGTECAVGLLPNQLDYWFIPHLSPFYFFVLLTEESQFLKVLYRLWASTSTKVLAY